MTIEAIDKGLRSLRRAQQVPDGTNNNNPGAASGPVNMSVISPAINYVDDRGIGHVKVNDNLDWSDRLSNDSTAQVVYTGSGSNTEILIIPAKRNTSGSNSEMFMIPAKRNTSDSTDSSLSSSHKRSGDGSTNPVYNLPTGSRDNVKPVDSAGLAYTGSDPVVLVIVGTVLALIAIASALAVAVYSRRNRERACSEDPSTPSEPFIVGSLPEHPVPDLSLLDTDMSPDLWLEGQYQYSPNMSQVMNSFNGTAILSDNKTTPMHHRLTVDAFPSSRRGRRGGRGDAGRSQRRNARHGLADYGNSMLGYSVRYNCARGNLSGSRGSWRDKSVRREGSILEDISDRGRRRKGITTPIVLYDENSTEEEHKSNSSKIQNRSRPAQSSSQRQQYQEQQQQRRRDKYSVAELVTKAEALVDQCQSELAVQFYEKALLQEPTKTSLLDSIGELSTELDNPERALSAFQQSVSLAPTQNPAKYFYLSQLVLGEQAEYYTKQGIMYLQEELQQHMDLMTPEALTIKKQICDALCSLGELYMTDLCDHEEAESRCEKYFHDAMTFDVGLPEPTQALANLRLVQQNKNAADELLEETCRRLNENCTEESLPSLEFRTATGKMLIEVERYEQACDVLEGVMQEDDENAELWFLVGTCYRAMDDLPNALEFFEKCQTMLNKLKKDLRDDFYLQDQLESVVETIAELKTSIANRPPELDEESGSDEDESAVGETEVGKQDVAMEE
ncbi:unnamed protein product [Peronospora farinosa]|uniref:Uncharacterized protein n=1 Tax=Peronospora farinosa TaxID=134698 RepID=A0ABN8CDU2_9STRA|nr:unnamed protein product [Peronospora farinosa]